MDFDAIYCCAGVCRRFNAARQFAADLRRVHVAQALRRASGAELGVLARIVRELGISQAAISRDVAALERVWRSSQMLRR